MRTGVSVIGAAILLVAGPAAAGEISKAPNASAPDYATWQTIGHIELGAGAAAYNGFGSETWGRLRGAARADVRLHDDWNVEVELGGDAYTYLSSSGPVGYSASSLASYGHLWKMMSWGAVGAFGGMSFGTQGALTTATAGLEGETYIGDATLGAQASFNRILTDSFGTDFWQGRAYGAYYFNPNSKIAGEVEAVSIEAGTTLTAASTLFSATGSMEHRFAGTPFSGWASASYQTTSSGITSTNMTTGLVGFRMFFDAPGSTLRDHDRQVPFKYSPQFLLLIPTVT